MGIRAERQELARSLTPVQRFEIRRILGPSIGIPLLREVDTQYKTDAELALAFAKVLPGREFVGDLAMALTEEQRTRIGRMIGFAKRHVGG